MQLTAARDDVNRGACRQAEITECDNADVGAVVNFASVVRLSSGHAIS